MTGTNLFQGVLSNTYEPDRLVTRAEWVAMVARSCGMLCSSNLPPVYTDVTLESRYYESISVVVHAGLVSCLPNGRFDPARLITRAEMAVLLVQMVDATDVRLEAGDRIINFTDRQAIPVWAEDAIEKVIQLSLLEGDSAGSFRPNDSLTQREAAVVLYRFLCITGAIR